MRAFKILSISAAVMLATTGAVWSSGDHTEGDEHGATTTRLLMPLMSSSRGMELFATKGCVSCHSINGLGGVDAVPLDAHNMDEYMNPFDLAAKMWVMAPYMIAAQEAELGGQIFFSGDELADIIAFLHDDVQQHEFKIENLSTEAAEMLEGSHGGEAEDADHTEGEETNNE